MGKPRIVYDRGGRGSPVVLLHGLGHRRQAWYPVLERLAQRHEVIAIDLPGFGQSSAPPAGERYDLDFLVDRVQRLCAELGLDRPHLAGNSLGGAVALELGARGAAASVTALSPIGFSSVPTRAGLRLLAHSARVAARIPEPVLLAAAGSPPARAVARRVLRGDHTAPPTRAATFDATALSPGSPFVRLAPLVAGYVFSAPDLPCPVTVAWGDRDRLLPASGARRALRQIPHARQVTLLGCGHIPMADSPHAVTVEILRTCHLARGGRGTADPAW